MQILVMRHGEAQAQAADDASRALTAHGRAQARAQGQWLAMHGAPDALWVSPYLRAQQTADEVLAGLGQPLARVTLPELTPSGDIAAITALLAGSDDCQRVLMVSHMPMVAYLVEALVPGEVPMAFATAEIVVIDREPKPTVRQRQLSAEG